jgi:predicted nucleotidyltransferase
MLNDDAHAALDELTQRDDPEILGLVLSGSAARKDMATELSDVDVFVVYADKGERTAKKTEAVDEIPVTLAELEEVPEFGTADWFGRWALAHVQVLRDRTYGRIQEACRRNATVDLDEQRRILLDHDRLDGYLNYAYRALKSDRDGRAPEARLDAAESVPWLLDTVFTLHGRVRPYMKYLPWELREHPLPGWPAAETLELLGRTLDGDPASVRELCALLVRDAAAYDARLAEAVAVPVIAGWGPELVLLRSSS